MHLNLCTCAVLERISCYAVVSIHSIMLRYFGVKIALALLKIVDDCARFGIIKQLMFGFIIVS